VYVRVYVRGFMCVCVSVYYVCNVCVLCVCYYVLLLVINYLPTYLPTCLNCCPPTCMSMYLPSCLPPLLSSYLHVRVECLCIVCIHTCIGKNRVALVHGNMRQETGVDREER